MLTLNTRADFTWGFGQDFLLEVKENNKTAYYVWSDPDYNGDNTIRPYNDDPMHFAAHNFMGRCKGNHKINDYCGEHVIIIL